MKHYLTDLRSKLADKKKNNKGFTLVELIVVIVILAILAALLVPALVGWIDKAREKSYAVEARTVYLAAQTLVSENYLTSAYDVKSDITNVAELSGVKVDSINSVTFDTGNAAKEKTIIGISVTFTPAGKADKVTMVLANGEWTKGTNP